MTCTNSRLGDSTGPADRREIAFLNMRAMLTGGIGLEKFQAYGAIRVYEDTPNDRVIEQIGGAEMVFLDGPTVIDRAAMDACPALRLIGSAATGYNNIEIEEARRLGIAVCNVPAYAAYPVAQHTIALLLEITNGVGRFAPAVRDGVWAESPDECNTLQSITLLEGKSLGIFGYGAIGRQVGRIAEALGMAVYPYSRQPEKALQADVISLHYPLTEETRGFVNAALIDRLKDGVILLNTARGGLIDEAALADALHSGKIAAAGLDVLAEEPPAIDHPLCRLPNCRITPHVGWMPQETRRQVMDICLENLAAFLAGESLNRIV